MSRDHISSEIKKIINDKSIETPVNFIMACAWLMGHFKGINLKILELDKSGSLADFFVLGSATNPTQMSAMADEISHQMREAGLNALSKEGLKASTDWILLDYGDFMVHIFSESARTVYDLDQLYSKATQIDIPENYYFSSIDSETNKVIDDKNYF